MNSPYTGKFRVTQIQHSAHDGLDLVGIDSKEIHSTVLGDVVYAGWENVNDKSQGFGLYVCVYSPVNKAYMYFGHLSEIRVKTGDTVRVTQVIGIEGSTGKSTGSHCHYCARRYYAPGNAFNISQISGIPNVLGVYDDGYRPNETKQKRIEIYIDGERKYSGLLD